MRALLLFTLVWSSIALELSFSASGDKTFGYTNKTGDRSGRMELQQIHVTPSGGTADPGQDARSGVGGGMEGEGPPTPVSMSLNEWVSTLNA